MAVERKMLPVQFPIDIEEGPDGRWLVTSPVVRQFLIVVDSKEEAVGHVENILARLAQAADEARPTFSRAKNREASAPRDISH